VRRIELQLGVDPSHYEPGTAAAQTATADAPSKPGTATTSDPDREALEV
jgi:hypothetical protein